MIIRRPYGERYRVPAPAGNDGRTKQSFKDACNINNIVATYVRTGQAVGSHKKGEYLDCTNATNYYDAMVAAQDARKAWLNVPAHIRDHFNDDPGALLDALADPDPAVQEELAELGLVPQDRSDGGLDPEKASPSGAKATADPPSATDPSKADEA